MVEKENGCLRVLGQLSVIFSLSKSRFIEKTCLRYETLTLCSPDNPPLGVDCGQVLLTDPVQFEQWPGPSSFSRSTRKHQNHFFFFTPTARSLIDLMKIFVCTLWQGEACV